MPKVFQIHEEDLTELERMLPQLSESMAIALTPCLRTQLRRCKTILSNVRWNYGPPSEVEQIPASPEDG